MLTLFVRVCIRALTWRIVSNIANCLLSMIDLNAISNVTFHDIYRLLLSSILAFILHNLNEITKNKITLQSVKLLYKIYIQK